MNTGDTVYIEYQKGTYLGKDGDLHKVEIISGDKKSIEFVPYEPRTLDFVPPEWITYENKPHQFTGGITCWLRDLRPILVFTYRSASLFRATESISEDKLKAAPLYDPSELWSEEVIAGKLEEISAEAWPLEKQIRELQTQVDNINLKKKDVYSHCFHKWTKGDEEETGRNFLGTGKKRECVCDICGKEETEYYTSLS